MTTSPQARLIYSASESDPHNEGSGWILAHTSIIMDIFPRSQKTGLFGDISRTVVRGKASERLKAAFRCVEEGLEIGFHQCRDGIDAFGIQTEILSYFEANGFSTEIADGRIQGFFHGTGNQQQKSHDTKNRPRCYSGAGALLSWNGRSASRRCCTGHKDGLQKSGSNPQDS